MTNTTTWRNNIGHAPAIYHAGGSDHASTTSTEAGRSVHDHGWTPYEASERAGLVALLIDHRTATVVAIRRASDVSEALGAKLHVVLAIPRGTATAHPDALVAYVADVVRARAPHCGFEIEVVREPIAEVGFQIARDKSADLAVVDAGFGAKEACDLADRLGVPVLVARDERRDGEWIAASDMQYFGFPVLSVARELAHALDRDVVYFHNARPFSLVSAEPMAGAESYTGMLKLQDDAAAAKRARLERFAHGHGRASSLLTRAGSTVGTLLGLASDREADVVVVGHHPRAWLWRFLGRSTAERLVDRSQQSVLIVPLEEWS
jgi:nucleotide-binding universal stress UspA family protein